MSSDFSPSVPARCVSIVFRSRRLASGSYLMTVPVEQLVRLCVDSWLDLEDPVFAECVLPDDLGREYARLGEDATQADWDGFYELLDKAARTLDVERLAHWYVELNDPCTFTRVTYEDAQGVEWLDAACTLSVDD